MNWPELSLDLNIIENIQKLVINDCDAIKKVIGIKKF